MKEYNNKGDIQHFKKEQAYILL